LARDDPVFGILNVCLCILFRKPHIILRLSRLPTMSELHYLAVAL
jgi:hypothetical protein